MLGPCLLHIQRPSRLQCCVRSPLSTQVCNTRTHPLQERSRELYELVVNREGYVFVCGDGAAMAKDVQVGGGAAGLAGRQMGGWAGV